MNERDLEKQLNQAKQPKWLDTRLKASKLSVPRKRELKAVVEKDERSLYDDRLMAGRLKRAAMFFDDLDDRQRPKVWEGLFPRMSPHIGRAWSTANERPYQFGYGRAPFRAPHRETLSGESRARFFILTCEILRGYDPDAAWLAAWAPHLPADYRDPHVTGWLLASILRGGGDDADEVRSILIDSINGDHDVGCMGDHAISALLNSEERSDWEIIGKLLLAAKRQEGLRQSILEAVDEANPAAFRYMLGLILEHDLGRFSSVVRAFDVWLGFQWAGGSAKVVHEGVGKLCAYLDADDARSKAIGSGEAADAYLAMWATAYADADAAIEAAASLVDDDDPAKRYAALIIAARVGLRPESIDIPVHRLLSGNEDDERILTFLCVMLANTDFRGNGYEVSDELFDAVAEIFEKFPAKKKPLDDLIWPWDRFVRERRDAAQALSRLASGNPAKLLPFADALEGYACANVIRELAGIDSYWDHETDRERRRKRRAMSEDERAFVVRMMADTRQDVHSVAFSALKGSKVTPDEVELLSKNLHRTSATFRRGAIDRLCKLPGTQILRVGEELLDTRASKKRAAGLEVLQSIAKDGKLGEKVKALVRERHETLKEDSELDAGATRILGEDADEATLDDCLGLVTPGSRARPIKPVSKNVPRETKAAKACLASLAELFLEHGETEIEIASDDIETGSSGQRSHITSRFPAPRRISPRFGEDPNATLERLPLREVWLPWVEERGKATRDDDGLELIRAWAIVSSWDDHWHKLLPKPFAKSDAWDLKWAFSNLVDWLPLVAARDDAFAYLVQCAEDSMAARSKVDAGRRRKRDPRQARDFRLAQEYLAYVKETSPQIAGLRARLAAFEMLAMDEGVYDCEHGPSMGGFGCAFAEGRLNEHDFTAWLLKDRAPGVERYWGMRYGPIDDVTRYKPDEVLTEHPTLRTKAVEIRDRLIEVELTRGERPTAATGPASEIKYAGGADVLFKLISALGKDKIVRQDQWGEPTRSYSFSRLISVTMPQDEDSDERFESLLAAHAVKQNRLLEVGMFAPQWAGHIERSTGAVGFEDAVWWIHAHTKRRDDWHNQDIREVWAAQINERTELDAEDLEEGAVDVAWFNRLIAEIGEEAWAAYQKPAKYASNSGGHKRAQLFADAMLARVSVDELMPRIDEKRHQDSVRAIGLAPLPAKAADATKETLARFKRLQAFKRESRTFGSQRQASEGRAVEIGMHNLARTAGFRDPRRLQWAMEAEAVADLAKGPVTVNVEETSVSLSINEAGAPELTVLKNGKPLKNVPAKLRKHEPIAELKSRVTDLRRQSSRMRQSLEESMCRGDSFSGAELVDFMSHPMLRPMIERLVFVAAEDAKSDLAGFPGKGGKVLCRDSGAVEPVGARDVLRLAHPSDLLARGDWHEWQHACFEVERVQPFKQIFRETYPRTASEGDNADMSRRYAGHQVNPSQASGLLKARQWVFVPEEGCRRVYHDEGLVAELWFQEHFNTPADVDGLTLEGVAFRKKGSDRGQVLLADVPDRIFSETMRDLDLVVSVAHAGGVDPEASASTIEMRSRLVQETCQLLGLSNVRVDGHHALVDGTRASYSIHLGSATTKVMPGRMLVIVAVHSQYRGRLFLPFADDDPKTAEVMAKALLLARDDEIKDPSILDQIGA